MLAIIGGTGFQNLEGFAVTKEHTVTTPFGPPSSTIAEVRSGARRAFFLPRHGIGHALLPSEINFRANIYALKSLGVTQVLGISAVGSLDQSLSPGDFVFASQYIDFTKGIRAPTFFGEGLLAHITTAEPICPKLADRAFKISSTLAKTRKVHRGQTYGCVEGPRLGTRAESFMLKNSGCHIVGMTNIPEAFLAREAQLCYASLCVVTDYDSWKEDRNQHVSVEKVFQLYRQSLSDVKEVVQKVALEEPLPACSHCRTLASALMSNAETVSPQKQELLAMLLQ